MKWQLIEYRVKFKRHNWGERWWGVNGYLHRYDDGPAWEDIKDGRRAWWDRGRFVKNSKCKD